VTVHQQHIWPDLVATDLDLLRESREHPHASAATQAAGSLEMQARAEQLVDELECLVVLDDPIIGSCR
jgi:hypothetical protein